MTSPEHEPKCDSLYAELISLLSNTFRLDTRTYSLVPLENELDAFYDFELGLLRFQYGLSEEEFNGELAEATFEYYNSLFVAHETTQDSREREAVLSAENYRTAATEHGEFDISASPLSHIGVQLAYEVADFLKQGRVPEGPLKRLMTTYRFNKLILEIQEAQELKSSNNRDRISPLYGVLHKLYGSFVLLHAETHDHAVPLYHLMQ